jgi:hypothetical protein
MQRFRLAAAKSGVLVPVRHMLSGVRIRRQVIDMPAGLFLDEHPRFFWFPGCLVIWPGNQ